MANVIKKATNKFTKGLVMDFSPENTKNEVLTHALNATLLTFNGNELSLLNDMGNGRVETAFLPEGYIPVGVCEYGGIIYIVSYNPLEDKSLIGCFPSPERNVSQDELGTLFNTSLSWEDFLEYKYVESATGLYVKSGQNYIIPESYTEGVKLYECVPSGDLTQVSQKVLLRNSNLNPGDKFIVYANPQLLDEKLQDLKVNDNPLQHPIIALNVVSIEDSGKIVYLNNDVRKYTVKTTIDGTEKTSEYHILGKNDKDASSQKLDIDSYRNVLSSGYSVFKEKTSGKLAILAELVMIDSYSVTHKIDAITDLYGNGIDGRFKVTISTDVSPYLTNDNYYTAPKLRYYYLKESLGKITGNLSETDEVEMFYNGEFNSSFSNLPIASLIDSNETLEGTLGNAGEFNFPKPNTYHGRLEDFNQSKHNLNEAYALLSPTKFYRIDKNQVLIEDAQNVLKYNEAYFGIELGAIIYEYVPEGTREKFEITDTFNISYIYEIESSKDEYVNVCRDTYYKDNGEKLYVQEPNIQLANKEIIDNPNVEKFYQQTLDIYKKILDIENIPEGTVIWINTNNGYATYQGSLDPSSVNYYTKEVVYKMVSGGYTLEDTSGNWFYYASSSIYREAESLEIEDYFDFNTYPKKDEDPYYGCEFILYRKLSVVTTTETVKEEEVIKSLLEGKDVYYITTYRRVTNPEDYTGVHLLFMTVSKDVLTSPDKFLPDPTKNYILGYGKPTDNQFPKDDLMILKAFAEFIPKEPSPENVTDVNALKYTDVKLAEIRIPQSFVDSNLDLPFKYSYTLEPCMNYGKLEHLLMSNTIDFSNLRNFDKSDFTTWKYRIDGNQLMLTFGADVYDTFETDKVSGLFLEFYDWRGFAGSLEISGKRSYSGKFTKILHLDTIGALSNKKIKMLSDTNGEFIESYNHNVNILEDSDSSTGYALNGNPVLHDIESEFGWRKVETDGLGNTVYKTLDEDNDCGVLYSNLIYGVKPYLIIQRETDIKIIKKPDLFLFTMPVYNDYYYSVDSFKRLMNPKVNLVLTYRLTDESLVYPYNLEEFSIVDSDGNKTKYPKIDNGYYWSTEEYQQAVQSYLKGQFDNETHALAVKQYFQYSGTTNLLLEIGLLLDYLQYNLSCDPSINDKFTCKLLLLDDTGNSMILAKTKDGILDSCKWDGVINPQMHTFGFETHINDSFISNFGLYNFLQRYGDNVIKIRYDYIVGFDALIENIRKNTTQATSVCALYHKNNDVYNNQDFGIREVINGDLTLYVSDAVIFNSGSDSELLVGLCRMSNPNGSTMSDQCVSYKLYSGVVKSINIPGKLNAGNPLRDIINGIGKLTFCQPHAHGLFASSASSIYKVPDSNIRVISKTNITLDIVKNPIYNMCVNTQYSMNNASEFISAINYGVHTYNSTTDTRFYGLSAKEVTKFNRCMLETMKNVYAYNPDYDNFPVNRGDVIVDDTQLQFTSNIITYDSKFTDDIDFNHFIKIGTIRVDNYLLQLNEYSDIAVKIIKINLNGSEYEDWVDGIKFLPDFTYCGVDSDNKYLVSSLTYNIPVPQKLYDDLQLDFSNTIIVKHHDGESWDFISGEIDKKCLYGWYPNSKKLISLDVLNYSINTNTGALKILPNGKYDVEETFVDVTLTWEEAEKLMLAGSNSITISRTAEDGSEVLFKVSISIPGGMGWYVLGLEPSYNENYWESNDEPEYNYWFYTYIKVPELGNYEYITGKYSVSVTPVDETNAVYIENIDVGLEGNRLFKSAMDTASLSGYMSLNENSFKDIIKERPQDGSFNSYRLMYYFRDIFLDPDKHGTYQSRVPLTYKDSGQEYEFFVYSGQWSSVWQDNSTSFELECLENETYHAVFRYKVPRFRVRMLKFKSLDSYNDSILHFPRTSTYYEFSNKGEYILKRLVDNENSNLVGSTLTLNDLVYYPEIDGHRLFVRNSMYLSKDSVNAILYRDNGSSNTDTSINALRTFTGPCYNASIAINEKDPEYNISNLNN